MNSTHNHSASPDDRYAVLFADYVAGQLDAPGRGELLGLIRANPHTAEAAGRDIVVDRLLRCALGGIQTEDAFVRAVRMRISAEHDGSEFARRVTRSIEQARPDRRFRRTLLVPLAAAAMLLAGVGLWWMASISRWNPEGGAIARVAEKMSGVRCSAFAGPTADGQAPEGKWVDLKVGDRIGPGMKIETEAGGRVRLAWVGEATVVDVAGDSKFEVRNSKLAGLKNGRLTLHVDKQPAAAPFVVETPHARATVVGTQLSLDVEPDRTRLEVTDGKVLLRRLADGRELDVASGRWAEFGDATRFAEGDLDAGLDAGLAGWWKLDETGEGPVRDSSGHDLHGTLVRRQHATAGEMKVNATNICVRVEGGLNPGTNAWTVALWFKSRAYSSGSQCIYSQLGLYEAHVKDGRLAYLWSPSTGWVGDRAFPVTLGRWHHVAVVYDKIRRVMYKDGDPVFSEEVTGDVGSNTNPLLLSARAGSDVPYQFFNGDLADVRIYSRALNAAEVAALARMKRDR